MAPLTKVNAAQVLDVKLKYLANEVKQLTHDETIDGYGLDLDDAVRRMNLGDISEVTSPLMQSAYLVIARWYALVRLASLLATRVDTQSFAVEGDRETVFNHVVILTRQAVDEAATYGYVLQTRDDGQLGSALTPVDPTGGNQSWERTYFGSDYLSPIPPGYIAWEWV